MLKVPVSDIRKRYIIRLVARCMILVAAFALYFTGFEKHDVLQGFAFFQKFSVMHLLWAVWMVDMLSQLIPVKNIALGSHKVFKLRFRPALERINLEALKHYIVTTTRSAYKVMLIWIALIASLGLLKHWGVLTDVHLFLTSVLFYVCDLICVLVWCPFRLIMKNRCCTTCRIFNWDHLMMFSPLFFLGGFYGLSLALTATLAFLLWEWMLLRHPERFWERTNAALRCASCTDKLCTQYCPKRTET